MWQGGILLCLLQYVFQQKQINMPIEKLVNQWGKHVLYFIGTMFLLRLIVAFSLTNHTQILIKVDN